MRRFLILLLLGVSITSYAQLNIADSTATEHYFEDQFYFGITYNFVRNKPDELTQRNLSYGLYTGFIKDVPLNASGKTALGIGLGVAINSYYSNLLVTRVNDGFSYVIGDEDEFKRSKLETHLVELPLEYRWRTSTVDEYRFWRIYAGVKLAYVVGARSKLVIDDIKDGFFNTDVNRFQYGLTLNFGYNTFNIHAYYALNDLFGETVQVDTETIGFRPLRIGIIFYIL